MYKILQNKTDRAKKEITELAKKLVRIPSPSLHEDKVADLVAGTMKELEYDKIVRDEWGNVVGVVYGQGNGPTLVLNSHMDTMEPDLDEWTRDPYAGEIDNGRLYGAGASDCKGGLAAQLFAGAILKHSLLPLRGNLVVAATVAEENGRSIGVKALMEDTLPSLELKADSVILGEPTNLGLHYGHDGWVHLDIQVEGSQPFRVEDAANGIYRELEENSRGDYDGFAGEEYSVEPPSFYEGQGSHGARIQMTRKIHHEDNQSQLIGSVEKSARQVAENYGGVAVKVGVQEEKQQLATGKIVVVKSVVNAWETDPYDPLIERSRQTLSAAGLEARPRKWQLNRLEMGTCGGVLVNEFNTPTIGYGPGTIAMAHATDEYVETENLAKAAFGTAVMAHGLIGIPVFGWTSDEI